MGQTPASPGIPLARGASFCFLCNMGSVNKEYAKTRRIVPMRTRIRIEGIERIISYDNRMKNALVAIINLVYH